MGNAGLPSTINIERTFALSFFEFSCFTASKDQSLDTRKVQENTYGSLRMYIETGNIWRRDANLL